ncbi:MAG: ISAs1 family transposase [Phycisphaerae bacterium]|nr:ISAs1 family transposase [Phycisphaerae bacterium]
MKVHIPEFQEMLELKELTVSIDTMGCQRKIANNIIEKQVHYVLALKGSQDSLLDDVKLFMDDIIANGDKEDYHYFKRTEQWHGRIELESIGALGISNG